MWRRRAGAATTAEQPLRFGATVLHATNLSASTVHGRMAACHTRYRLVHDMVLNVGGRTLRTDVGAGFSIYLFSVDSAAWPGRNQHKSTRTASAQHSPVGAVVNRRGEGRELPSLDDRGRQRAPSPHGPRKTTWTPWDAVVGMGTTWWAARSSRLLARHCVMVPRDQQKKGGENSDEDRFRGWERGC